MLTSEKHPAGISVQDTYGTTAKAVGVAVLALLVWAIYEDAKRNETEGLMEYGRTMSEVDCHEYHQREIGREYERCMRAALKARSPNTAQVDILEIGDHSVLGCAKSTIARWCDIELVTPGNMSALTVSRERWGLADPTPMAYSITLNSVPLGDECWMCSVHKWTLTIDTEKTTGAGLWIDEEAQKITQALGKAISVKITPAELDPEAPPQEVAGAEFTAPALEQFQERLARAERYIERPTELERAQAANGEK